LRVVASDGTTDAPTDLAPGRSHGAKDKPTEKPATRSSWRTIALPLLAVVVSAQGGLLGYWFLTGRAAAEPESGSVAVTSDPPGAPVLVDGVSRGATPFSIALKPGPHKISVGTREQLQSQTVSVTNGGDARVFFELPRGAESAALPIAPAVGGLEVVTEPPGAQVVIDGAARGVAPLTVSDLKAGEHAVVVKGTGEAVSRTVTVQTGTVASLVISMNSAGAFASGWVAISGVPVQISENGTLLGTTETPRILVPAGAHELELTNAALEYRVIRPVQVVAGQTLSITLKAPQGTLSINALPWAEVWVDGKPVGETPIGNLSLTIGNHELLFRHPELGEQRKTVTVGALKPVRVGVDLRK
jgi:serine/threonine-protein kinase